MQTYTVTLTEHQRSRLIATLRIENERLHEYLTSFDRPGDEAERGSIQADIAENIELIDHLKAAASNQG